MIRGTTTLIAHLGHPTETFKAPMIYNPYFEQAGIDAAVVPMGVNAEEYPQFLKLVFRLSNIGGALVTMPHKVTTVALLDEATPAVRIAGSCNAVRRAPDGRLQGDMFDGEGFMRGVARNGRRIAGVQQGTNHAWINRGPGPCRLAMVFIDAQEPAALRPPREQ